MSPPSEITQLVERFERFEASYRASGYKETEVRREFIDPFFSALGWDVSNNSGKAPATKDVVHEYSLNSGPTKRMPDYSFRIGGETKFFVEAKKPSVDLKEGVVPALQLRTYAWSAQLPVSILTDFQEFAFYDCLHEPAMTDGATNARLKYFSWTEYEARWDEIEAIVSRQAVLNGSLDSFDIDTRQVVSVDAAFLDDIDSWRRLLAENVAELNPHLTSRELNFCIQQTIDRIIFLRICEDRGIEEQGRLRELARLGEWGQSIGSVYERLIALFQEADEKYNSGLFHFRDEKGRAERPDDLSLGLMIDNHCLQTIIRRLYFPESPYRFGVFPIDILGHVYEQFLGKVVRLDRRKGAVVEEKPEVKKAGGVYYTPSYIVDYIVRQTVADKLQGRSPRQAGGEGTNNTPLRILDPACGSGSFLIGAYEYLLVWYLESYVQNGPNKWSKGRNPRLYRGPDDEWLLTSAERRRILLTHIYGVDIDPQAVEVTKLSLVLKLLEGETRETLLQQLKLFHERALPDLGKNIKCGNSLIGPEFFGHRQSSLMDDAELYKINAFDWSQEFPTICPSPETGFDVIIGNPPYINVRILGQIQGGMVKEFFKSHYASARKAYDIYVLFIERSYQLLKAGGRFGMIVPNKIATLDYALECRRLLLERTSLHSITDVSTLKVFGHVGVYPYVMVWDSRPPLQGHEVNVVQARNEDDLKTGRSIGTISQEWLSPETGLTIHGSLDIESRVATRPLSTFGRLQSGTTGFSAHETAKRLKERAEAGRGEFFEFIVSGNIDRYIVRLGSVRFMKRSFERPVLAAKDPGLSPNKIALFASEKIVIAGMTKKLEAAYDEGGLALGVQVYAISDFEDHPLYLLGILNSKLMSYLFRIRFQAKHLAGGYLAINKGQLEQLPVRTIEGGDGGGSLARNDLVKLVKDRMSLQARLDVADTSYEQTVLQRQIDSTDGQLDGLVYGLYGLSDVEIDVVEEAERLALE